MQKDRCIIIPAVKKAAVIPDQLVKKLAGVTLIQRALNTAKKLANGEDIHIVTDSEEISMICSRNHVKYHYNKALKFSTPNILRELRFYIEKVATHYENIIVYRASSPLVDHHDIQAGYNNFIAKDSDILVTLKRQEQRIWRESNGRPDKMIYDETKEPVLIEIKSFIILKSSSINGGFKKHNILPHYLDEKAIEISSYQDWWICEKLLKQKRIIFVVTGYPAVGLGHVYRALTLAHEITDHRIIFLCTKESELAVKRIAEKDYATNIQTGKLLEDVLKLDPDLVVNDILDTDLAYVKGLKERGVKVVNFEDTGPGAGAADLVVNALFSPDVTLTKKYHYGSHYFCLRDEFIGVDKNRFRRRPKTLLITFGGTDQNDFTLQSIQALKDICELKSIKIFVVTGPGYLHKAKLENYLESLENNDIEYIHQTGMMSAIMQQSDIAICSAGRTVYELAHMRVPAIVLAQNEREDTHSFARDENGFEYLGLMKVFDTEKLRERFFLLLENDHRYNLFNCMENFCFERNKNRVINKILALLKA
jgi:spore coat polysaccharide biosynthesis predicted glycosyltransferase SpsG